MNETAMPVSSAMEKHTVSEPAGCGNAQARAVLLMVDASQVCGTASLSMWSTLYIGHVGVGDEGIAHGEREPRRLHQQG
jgi:hypothetical protein